jgi:hypothetical protein
VCVVTHDCPVGLVDRPHRLLCGTVASSTSHRAMPGPGVPARSTKPRSLEPVRRRLRAGGALALGGCSRLRLARTQALGSDLADVWRWAVQRVRCHRWGHATSRRATAQTCVLRPDASASPRTIPLSPRPPCRPPPTDVRDRSRKITPTGSYRCPGSGPDNSNCRTPRSHGAYGPSNAAACGPERYPARGAESRAHRLHMSPVPGRTGPSRRYHRWRHPAGGRTGR